MATPLPANDYTLNNDIKFRVKVKGMTFEEAIQDLEKILRTKFDEKLIDLMRRESYFWR